MSIAITDYYDQTLFINTLEEELELYEESLEKTAALTQLNELKKCSFVNESFQSAINLSMEKVRLVGVKVFAIRDELQAKTSLSKKLIAHNAAASAVAPFVFGSALTKLRLFGAATIISSATFVHDNEEKIIDAASKLPSKVDLEMRRMLDCDRPSPEGSEKIVKGLTHLIAPLGKISKPLDDILDHSYKTTTKGVTIACNAICLAVDTLVSHSLHLSK